MPIGKVSYMSVNRFPRFGESKKQGVQKNTSDENKAKSNVPKYIAGGVILAGLITLGIAGHKNNWWRKAAKNEFPEHKIKSFESNERIEIPDHNPNPRNGGEQIPDTQVTEPQIDDAPFTRIEGMRYDDNTIVQFDNEGRVVREFNSQDGKHLSYAIDYTKSGDMRKKVFYRPDGSVVYEKEFTDEYKRTAWYRPNGLMMYEDVLTADKQKRTLYDVDGSVIFNEDAFRLLDPQFTV